MQNPKSNRLNNIKAANRLRYRSPQFKEVLRERCRKQIREKRNKLFSERRIGLDEKNESVESTLTEIVRQEFSNMSSLLNDSSNSLAELMEWPEDEFMSIEEEMIRDEEQWIIEEYYRMHQYELDMMDKYLEEIMKNELICPMCEKGVIAQQSDLFVCPNCQLCLPASGTTMDDFYERVKDQTDNHSKICNSKPSFIIIPENDTPTLYLTCESCSFIGLI